MKTSNRPRPCDHDRDTELRDQATRASKGCFLQLCEGLPNDGVAMRRKYFVEANDSLHETVGAIDLAATLGMMSIDQANGIQALAVRLKARPVMMATRSASACLAVPHTTAISTAAAASTASPRAMLSVPACRRAT